MRYSTSDSASPLPRSKGRARPWRCRWWLLVALLVRPPVACGADVPAPAPEWIWSADAADEIELRHTWPGRGPYRSARLRLAAESASVDVQLNARSVCRIEAFGPWIDVDLPLPRESGEQELRLTCRLAGDDPRVACEVRLEPDRGATQVLTSTAAWQGRPHTGISATAPDWRPCRSLGPVPMHLWDAGTRSIDITPFDDYEQWRQALADAPQGAAAPETFLLPDGFEIEKLRQAGPDEGSWVSCVFDPQGRLLIAREDRGLLRLTFSGDRRSIAKVAALDAAAELKECRGLAYLGRDLYVQANNSKGLYLLRDSDGDGEPEPATLVREFPGPVGHGRNDLAVHDGRLYCIYGDDVEIPTTNIEDLTSPNREARRGAKTSEGFLTQYDPRTGHWKLLAAGLRNPFGVAVHPRDGTIFTYDADAEHDMGAPWYRPTRIVQLQPGGDYGWRGVTGQWPPYYPDHPDHALPVMDIGKGSPTAVQFGHRSRFPAPYREALFVLDWAYGRILAVHLWRRGQGYYGRAEVFLRGRPLNVTDLDFGPDGALYLVTGGRKTQSALYRVRWTGAEPTPPEPIPDAATVPADDRLQPSWLSYGSRPAEATAALDPHRRRADLIALEHLLADPEVRSDLMETLTSPSQADDAGLQTLDTLLALARTDAEHYAAAILQRWNELPLANATATQQLTALRVCQLCLQHRETLDPGVVAATRARLAALYPDPSPPTFTPVGMGGPVNHRLAELLALLEAPEFVAKTLGLLRAATAQEDRVHYLFVLRNVRDGWTSAERREYFAALGDLDLHWHGGRGMPTFLQQIRRDALATLTPEELAALGELAHAPATGVDEPLPARPVVRAWSLDDLKTLAGTQDESGAADRGRELFRAALCSRCHRVGAEGASVGPDLTSVGNRFSREDILRSILDPAAVIAEPYRNVEVLTTDGRLVIGQVVRSGDYREGVLRIQTDPLRPSQVVEVAKRDIEMHRDSMTSPMPAGLLNTLTAQEVRDLLAFLVQGGLP